MLFWGLFFCSFFFNFFVFLSFSISTRSSTQKCVCYFVSYTKWQARGVEWTNRLSRSFLYESGPCPSISLSLLPAADLVLYEQIMCIYTLANIRLIQPIVNILTKTSSFYFCPYRQQNKNPTRPERVKRYLGWSVCIYTRDGYCHVEGWR